tara:strand:+ start:79 stop:2454 length:2376 start_codon:yes stop_codon:yes gene_type:complete
MDTVPIETGNATTSRLDGAARTLLRLVVFLLPLAVFPTAWLPLAMGKMSIIALGVFAALLLWTVARFKEQRVVFPNTNVLWTSLLLIVGYVVTAVLSGNIMQSFVGFGFERDTVIALFTFVATLSVAALTTEKVVHFIRLQQAALAAFFIIAIFQIVRVVIGGDVILPTLFSNDSTVTVLGSWNDLGVMSGLALIMALSGLALFTSRAVRGVLYLLSVLALFLLVLVNLLAVWVTLMIAALLISVYIFSDASHDQKSGTFTPRFPWKRIAPSGVVVLVSLVFIFGGSVFSTQISETFNIAYVDVRPSWEGTITAGTGALKENTLFGVGPNSFREAWVDYKPQAVNETNFWSVDFNFGIGYIPSAFVTGGLVVGVLWLLFFASFIHLGFRLLIHRAAQPAHMYMIISSFLGAGYLWVLTIVYVPQTVVLAYTFILTGIVIAAARISGVLKVGEIRSHHNYAAGIAVTEIFVAIFVITIAFTAITVERIRTNVLVSNIVAAANAGDLNKAETISERRISLFPGDVRPAQLRTNIGVAKLSEILNEENADTEDLQARFQEELTKTISAAQSVVTIDGDNYQSWLLLADVYSSLVPLEIEGSYDSAVAAYAEAQTRNARTPQIPLSLARLALNNNDIQGAKTYAREALALKSNYTDAFYLLSQIAIGENNVEDAIASTESVVVLNPNNTGLLFQLGVLQYSVEAYDRVIPVLERAVALDPNYSNALYYLGLAYEKLDNAEGALAVFERIAVLNPENEEIQTVVEALREGGSAAAALEQVSAALGDATELPVSEDN